MKNLASTEREPVIVVWGLCPSREQWQRP